MKREDMQELIDRRQEQRADLYQIQRQTDTEFTINKHQYLLLTNYRDAFQPDRLAERFSSILSKYDYIVGDWGFDQLRLKGFYAPENPLAQKTTLVDTIQDYLYEYCNFGCAYFVIQNLNVRIPQNELGNNRTSKKRSSRNSNTKPKSKTAQSSATSRNKVKKGLGKKVTGQNSKVNKSGNPKKSQASATKQLRDSKRKPQKATTRNNRIIKPQIKEREVVAGNKPVNERKNQTATRVAGNQKTKQKFVIRHK